MKTAVFFYTGTGNSLWLARRLAEGNSGTQLLSLNAGSAIGAAAGAEAVGLAFPVHMWGVPRRIVNFVSTLPRGDTRYYFALAANAGQVSETLMQLKGLLADRGIKLSAGFQFVLPSNYIPWGGAEPAEKQAQRFAAARKKMSEVSALIAARAAGPVEKGPLWEKLLLSGLCYPFCYRKVPEMDKAFFAGPECDACGLCVRLCPAGNIELRDGRPAWKNRCEQCLACIQFCPRRAIQFGKRTAGYARYRNPEVTAADLLAAKPA